MNVADALNEQIYNEINVLASPIDVEINSRYAVRQAMQDSKTIMMVLGIGISLILGLICVLNFVNVISVSTMTRNREFAALESVGMSKSQMRQMLKNERAGYAIIVILCAIIGGDLIAYGPFYPVQEYGGICLVHLSFDSCFDHVRSHHRNLLDTRV